MRKKLVALFSAAVLSLALVACSDSSTGDSGSGDGGDYPKNNITIVAPSGAGGGWDLTARSIGKVMNETKIIEKPITIENQPGGGGARVYVNKIGIVDKGGAVFAYTRFFLVHQPLAGAHVVLVGSLAPGDGGCAAEYLVKLSKLVKSVQITSYGRFRRIKHL